MHVILVSIVLAHGGSTGRRIRQNKGQSQATRDRLPSEPCPSSFLDRLDRQQILNSARVNTSSKRQSQRLHASELPPAPESSNSGKPSFAMACLSATPSFLGQRSRLFANPTAASSASNPCSHRVSPTSYSKDVSQDIFSS
jgi:hypothetical protein